MGQVEANGEESRHDDPADLIDRWTAHQADRADRAGQSAAGGAADAPRHAAAPRSGESAPYRVSDAVAVSRDVLDALSDGPDHDGDVPADDVPASGVVDSATEAGPSLDVDFAPRLAARRIVGLLLAATLAATLAAAWLAYEDPRPLTLGGAGVLLVLTLALYAVRAGSAPTYLAIRSGQLEVRRGKTLETFDLSSRYTRIEVVGRPGRPGWKVLLGRFGREPLVLTASVVDPRQLTEQLERYRPDLGGAGRR